MSNHLISTTYKRDLGTGTRKSVMALMADKASDDGRGIWASKQTMADELCLTKKTVIVAIQSLLDDGLLLVVGDHPCATGHTVEYAINVRALEELRLVGCWQRREARPRSGAGATPVKDLHRCNPDNPTSVAATPKPPLEPIPLSTDKSVDAPPKPDPDGDDPHLAKRPHPLPEDWEPPAIDALRPEARGLVGQWPRGAYPAMCANFANHWHDAGARNRRKSDWARALANWLIRVHSEVMRAAKAGVIFEAAAIGAAARTDPVPAVRAKARECPRSAAVHRLLQDATGPRVHAHWIAPCALVFARDGAIEVIGPGDFVISWVRQNYAGAIAAAGRTITPALAGVRFSVERHAAEGN